MSAPHTMPHLLWFIGLHLMKLDDPIITTRDYLVMVLGQVSKIKLGGQNGQSIFYTQTKVKFTSISVDSRFFYYLVKCY